MSVIPHITVQLVHMQGPLKGEIQELTEGEIRIGRHPDCQVQFPKEMVTLSRVHARIVREGNRFKLIDQSTNGSYVNGQRISEAYLKDGDVLMFAEGGPKVSFLTQISDAQPARQPMPAPTSTPPAAPVSQPIPPRQAQPARVQSFQPLPAGSPSQPPQMPAPAPPAHQTSPPLQPQPAAAVPAAETVKAPLAIQDGPALKSFQSLPIVIGSGPGCDFTINHPGIHDRHAQFFFAQNRYWVKDLTGMNCIMVDGQPINVQMLLEPNMQLSLGEHGPKFRFLGGGRLAEIEDPLTEEPPPKRPPDNAPQKQEWSEKLSEKAGGLIKKFFS